MSAWAEVFRLMVDLGERAAIDTDRCSCGRPAVLVLVAPQFGMVGWCGIADGGARQEVGR